MQRLHSTWLCIQHITFHYSTRLEEHPSGSRLFGQGRRRPGKLSRSSPHRMLQRTSKISVLNISSCLANNTEQACFSIPNQFTAARAYAWLKKSRHASPPKSHGMQNFSGIDETGEARNHHAPVNGQCSATTTQKGGSIFEQKSALHARFVLPASLRVKPATLSILVGENSEVSSCTHSIHSIWFAWQPGHGRKLLAGLSWKCSSLSREAKARVLFGTHQCVVDETRKSWLQYAFLSCWFHAGMQKCGACQCEGAQNEAIVDHKPGAIG